MEFYAQLRKDEGARESSKARPFQGTLGRGIFHKRIKHNGKKEICKKKKRVPVKPTKQY